MSSRHQPAPRNVGSSGALIAANAENGVAVFSGYDLGRGAIRSGRVAIANIGAAAGAFRLFELDASNSFAAGDLTLVIDDVSGAGPLTVYRGDIGALPSEGIELDRFEPGEERTYRFIVAISLDSPNGGQGRGAGAVYEWSAAIRD